jgi:hypothetical protein
MSTVTRGLRPHPAPKVLGILSIVFGGIVILMTLVGLTMSGVGAFEQLPGVDMAAAQIYIDALEPWATILMMSMIAMSGALVAIGIGQLKYQRWARTAAIGWSLLGFVIIIGLLLQHYLVTVPALEVFLGSLGGGNEVTSMMRGLTGASGIVSVILYAPYPIIMLVLMRKPAVIESMVH